MRKYLPVLLAALLAAAAVRAGAQVYSGDLPQIGEPADAAMSPAEEKKLGSQVVTEFYSHDFVLEDPEISDFITALGYRIVSASETTPPPMTFFVVKDDRINAFALPGGYIGMNAGTITTVANESELAGVLGHEMAHVTQRHIARAIEGQETANIATWAAVLAAILAGSANPDVVLAALSVGQAATYERQVGFTRSNEMEADRIGIQTMARAGFDPDAMASFFQRLEQQSRLYGNQLPEFLRTHPVNTTRISEARNRAASLPKHKVTDPVDFRLIQARTRVLAADTPGEAVEYYAAQNRAAPDVPEYRYGLAMAQLQQGDATRAGETLKPLLDPQRGPPPAAVSLLAGRIQLAARQPAAGLQTLAQTLDRFPRYTPAIFEYAEALMDQNQPEKARQVLISHEQGLGTRMDTYRLLALAARASGNNAESQYQMANYLYARGDVGGAVAALDAGLRIKSLSSDDRAKLVARRDEIAPNLPRGRQTRTSR